ncbi:MAG: BglII/BstYI family type II restriction endonuclease [Dongiaceae bacterium]
MRIAAFYSHLNGWESLKIHRPRLWKEIQQVIAAVDAAACRTKVSKEKTKKGKLLFAPKAMNEAMKAGFRSRGWTESRTSYWVTSDAKLIRKTMQMSAADQKAEIQAAGYVPIFSYNQTDFVKERIAVEVQFGKYAFVAFDLFVKHLAFYVGDMIDVGVEILPMKELQAHMSSGPSYYEGELYNLIRGGRGVPPVPLVLVGVAADIRP